jgi:serine/threonine protein phosphatase PrpC
LFQNHTLTMNLWFLVVMLFLRYAVRAHESLTNPNLRKRAFLPSSKLQLRQFWLLRGGGETSAETIDLAIKRKPFLHMFPVSVCSIRGQRDYMEDEFLVAPDFCGVFDGHGGKAVSRYLRQNLYANLQASLPNVVGGRNSSDPRNLSEMAPSEPPTIEDYETALYSAISKVDREVTRISHWSYQGSTAATIWIHQDGDKMHLLTANVGDSRVVLSRNASAVNLSKDHKPNDPDELARIQSVGGSIIWHGQVDEAGHPVPGTGLWRVNGNLALSRAIGDRAERP